MTYTLLLYLKKKEIEPLEQGRKLRTRKKNLRKVFENKLSPETGHTYFLSE